MEHKERGKEKILIVEDSEFFLHLLGRILAKAYDVVLAKNGAIAVEEFNASHPDLVLMDLEMPVMGGLEAVKILRSNPQNIMTPILVLSGSSESEKRVELLNEGANDFIPKPFEKSELLARVKTHLKLARLHKQLDLRNRQFELEKELARKVQENLLPDNNEMNIPGLTIHSYYCASEQVGGDFFDFWIRPEKKTAHFLIGDVSGHGVASALMMSAWKGVLFNLGQSTLSPLEVVATANQRICAMMKHSEETMFLTLVYCVLDQGTKKMSIISAGHNPVYLLGDQTIQAIHSSGPPLGILDFASWKVQRCRMAADTGLFLYTDGIVEAMAEDKELYGNKRLEKVLKQNHDNPQKLISTVLKEVRDFNVSEEFDDDITMLALQMQS